MDNSLQFDQRVKVIGLLSLAFFFLFVAYLFAGSWFVLKYVSLNATYLESLTQVLTSSAFWFFFFVQLIVYSIMSFVILNTFYNEHKMTLMQQEFVNNVTHEIKTPLSTILMAAEVLVEDNIHSKPFRKDQYISIIRTEGERLREELDRVLEVSRMTNIGMHLNKEEFSVYAQLDGILERMGLQFKNYRGRSVLNWKANDCFINFDKKSFDLIITNIIDNSLKYNITEPSVTIDVWIEGGSVVVQIGDNGIGIPEKHLPELFHRFFRVPIGETHHIKGFGLGLYLVKQLMDAHNSVIFVTSIEKVGTTITLKFPIVKQA